MICKIIEYLLFLAVLIVLGLFEYLDMAGRLDILEKKHPRTWRFINLRPTRLVLLLLAVGLLAKDTKDAMEIPQPPPIKMSGPTISVAPSTVVVQSGRSNEPSDSLRRRTLRLADEYTDFFMKSQENAPPVAIPTTPEPPPSEEQKKARQIYRDYWGKIDKDYADHFSARFMGIVKEYESKGAKVGFLERDFAQRRPQIPPTGSTWEGMDEISRFRELAYHVDARDHLIVVAP